MTRQTSSAGLPATLAAPEVLGDTVLRKAIESARDGISISDARQPEMPLVYVNAAFERMTGYSAEQVLGLNCRFLQGDDALQGEVDKIRRALATGGSCIVTLRNYRRNGKLFYNELSLSPVRDEAGEVTHFIGIQKDVTRRVRAEQRLRERDRDLQRLNAELERMARCDSLTGLLNRRTFDECLDREWRRALRESAIVSLYMVDVDHFKMLNDRFGHAAGDVCLRRVAATLEERFGRASDFVARYGGEEFVILTSGLPADKAAAKGQEILAAMRAVTLPDPVPELSVSVGVASATPSASITPAGLLKAADDALYAAKAAGRDRLEIGVVA